mmetsp:Transcript_37758/g.84180  ORF Transcript_37758/g.84180 Transcript_37758/m.84180 type:complete len:994 (+) Transcript_37758:287-3268(+)|eukprot:CAMPEP_0202892130 /NCGR_PEP_ID=MMETSP1392-20130828/1946_1 /ASSEMBLY_ACC=CAM_ASM_000868 /TAXON_ID=225041 /ORGANISM="Chlamydomonas chlamydogama, Strain SAG 11-48b" /LENGTH=993 /DNA_ID=CAMNT_0049576011 /DNA_START=183 /DNA_END=3164 /DNA_ORIENTATION=-
MDDSVAIVDTEGLVVGLYHHLWMKNEKGHTCPVNVPHTVIYRDSQPVAWYFSSLKESKIMRKKKSSMMGSLMAQQFTVMRDPAFEVAAWFSGNMTHMASSPRKASSRPSPNDWMNEQDDTEVEELAMEYLTADRVQHLLDPGQYNIRSEELYDGVLQKFVEPRDANDFIIRAIWTPTACVFEKRTNKQLLKDGTIPLTDRIAAFSGSVWLNDQCTLSGGVMSARLEAKCDAVVKHLREVTNGVVIVQRMELFFKVDLWNRIWLLYCNSLKLDAPNVPRTIYTRSASANFSLKDPTKKEEVAEPEDDKEPFVCVMTGRTCPGPQRIQVTYKLLIQHWFLKNADLANESDRIHAIDNIPPTLRRANPNLTREFYLKHRAQPMFLLNTASVCPEAAAELAKASLHDLAQTIARPFPIPRATDSGRPHSSSRRSDASPSRSSALQLSPQQAPRTPPTSASMRPGAAGSRRPHSTPSSRSERAGLTAPPPPPSVFVRYNMPAFDSSYYGQQNSKSARSMPSALMPKAAGHPPASSMPALPRPVSSAARAPPPVYIPASPGATHNTTRSDFSDLDPPSTGFSPHSDVISPGAQHLSASGLRTIDENLSMREERSAVHRRGGPGHSNSPQRSSLSSGGRARNGNGNNNGSRQSSPVPTYARKNSETGDSTLNSTLNSTSGSRRQSLLSTDEMKTLKELSEAYSQAEQVTQRLLAEAHEILQAPLASRSADLERSSPTEVSPPGRQETGSKPSSSASGRDSAASQRPPSVRSGLARAGSAGTAATGSRNALRPTSSAGVGSPYRTPSQRVSSASPSASSLPTGRPGSTGSLNGSRAPPAPAPGEGYASGVGVDSTTAAGGGLSSQNGSRRASLDSQTGVPAAAAPGIRRASGAVGSSSQKGADGPGSREGSEAGGNTTGLAAGAAAMVHTVSESGSGGPGSRQGSGKLGSQGGRSGSGGASRSASLVASGGVGGGDAEAQAALTVAEAELLSEALAEMDAE